MWTVICESGPFFCCVYKAFVCCAFSISFFFRLWIICNRTTLFLAMVSIMLRSTYFAYSLIGSVIILFMWKMYAAILCSNGRFDIKCIVVSVCLVILWIPKYRMLLFLWQEKSKWFMLLFSSSVSLNSKYCILYMWLVIESPLFLFWSIMIRMSSIYLYSIFLHFPSAVWLLILQIIGDKFRKHTWYRWTHSYVFCGFKISIILLKLSVI
jgi:hypothetical protein